MSEPMLGSGWFDVATGTHQQRVKDAWKDAPLVNLDICALLLEVAKQQVLEYAPKGEPAVEIRRSLEGYGYTDDVIVAALAVLGVATPVATTPPANYVWAQLQQAKNLWNAGRVAANGEVGADGWSFAPRPLDREIQRIIRPTAGVPDVF